MGNTLDALNALLDDSGSSSKFNLYKDYLSSNPTTLDLLNYIAYVVKNNSKVPIAFKGGWLLQQLVGTQGRTTKDVDLSISSKEAYDEIKALLKDVCEFLIEVSVIDSYEIKDTIEPRMSGGFKAYKNGVEVTGMDIGLHDIDYGVTYYTYTFPLDGFMVERMIADKTLSLLSRKRFRRVKDLYDFYVITQNFDIDINQVVMFMVKRDTPEWKNIPFNDNVITELKRAWDKLSVKSFSSVADIQEEMKPDFVRVLRLFNLITNYMKVCVENNLVIDKIWSHERGALLDRNE